MKRKLRVGTSRYEHKSAMYNIIMYIVQAYKSGLSQCDGDVARANEY